MYHIKEDCGHVPTIKEWLFDLRPKKFSLNFKSETNDNQTEAKTVEEKVSI